jgi:hypothetical protein
MFMYKIFTFLVVVMFWHITAVQAQNLTDSYLQYGRVITNVDARSLSLGGSGIAGGYAIHGAGLNPALLARMDNELDGFVSGMITRYEEDRAYPYYDNFGGFVDFGSYVYNSEWYGDYALAVNFDLTPFTGIKTVAGISTEPFIGFNYDYIEEVRTTGFTDEILAYNKILSDGGWRQYALSAGIEILKDWSLGLKLGMLGGSVNQRAEIYPVSGSLNSIAQLETCDITLESNTITADIGMFYQVDPHFGIAAVARMPYTLTTDDIYQLQTNDPDLPRILDPDRYLDPALKAGTSGYDSLGRSESIRNVDYPLRLGAGLEYRFKNILEARISADFEYIFWSDMKDSWRPQLIMNDVYIIRLGVEHIFFDKMPFRVGFNYQPLKENKNYTRSIFTMGIGLSFEKYQIDFAGGFENMTSNQPDLFPDGLYPPLTDRTESIDRVKTSNFYGIIEFRFFLNNIISKD